MVERAGSDALSVGAGLTALPTIESLDFPALEDTAMRILDAAEAWDNAYRRDGITIQSAILEPYGVRAYRSTFIVDSSLERVATVLADETFEHLGAWNREFVEGETLEVLHDATDDRRWLLRVRYRTPAPLRDREYLYAFRRHDVSPDEVRVTYQSVAHPRPAERGALRALLHPTIHRCVALGDRTRIEHVLVSDLGGVFRPFVQRRLLKGPLVDAHVRDASNLQHLLGGA